MSDDHGAAIRVSVTFDVFRKGRAEGSKSAHGPMVFIGEGRSDGISLQGGGIRHEHAAILATNEGPLLATVESAVIKVGGVPLALPRILASGDEFEMGTFRLVVKHVAIEPDHKPPRFVSVSVLSKCPHCGHPLPLHGPHRVWHCTQCLQSTEAGPRAWAPILGTIHDSSDQGGDWAIGPDTRIRWAVSKPKCLGCKAPLPVDDIPVGTSGSVHCPQCGHANATSPAPNWMKGACLAAKQFYHAEMDTSDDAPAPVVPASESSAVMLGCPNCGGSLKIDAATERTTKCSYCSVDVYLPDDLWRRLHPVATASTWFVRFEGPTTADRELDKRMKKLLSKARQKVERASGR